MKEPWKLYFINIFNKMKENDKGKGYFYMFVDNRMNSMVSQHSHVNLERKIADIQLMPNEESKAEFYKKKEKDIKEN
jgi:hypothetical protein